MCMKWHSVNQQSSCCEKERGSLLEATKILIEKQVYLLCWSRCVWGVFIFPAYRVLLQLSVRSSALEKRGEEKKKQRLYNSCACCRLTSTPDFDSSVLIWLCLSPPPQDGSHPESGASQGSKSPRLCSESRHTVRANSAFSLPQFDLWNRPNTSAGRKWKAGFASVQLLLGLPAFFFNCKNNYTCLFFLFFKIKPRKSQSQVY